VREQLEYLTFEADIRLIVRLQTMYVGEWDNTFRMYCSGELRCLVLAYDSVQALASVG
jgi:hypothetical protein